MGTPSGFDAGAWSTPSGSRIRIIPIESPAMFYQSASQAAVYQTQFLSHVIEDFQQSPSEAELKLMCRWFSFIPSYLGTNPTLDTAVRCFTVHQLGRMRDDDQMKRWAKTLYVEALQRLQKSLRDPERWLSSETMCACTVLCMFEVGPFTRLHYCTQFN